MHNKEEIVNLNVKAENNRIMKDNFAKTIKALISVKTKDLPAEFDK